MRTFDPDGFRRHLDHLLVDGAPRIVVHSRLVTFGARRDHLPWIGAELEERAGPTGLVAAPAYRLGQGLERSPYRPSHSPSVGVGALSEFLRSQSSWRSLSPIHSHSFSKTPTGFPTAYGESLADVGLGSDFDIMSDQNFLLLLLGCEPDEGATFLHHIEALAGVPYRQWLELSRNVDYGNFRGEVKVAYYARRPGARRSAFSRLFAKDRGLGSLRKVSINDRFSYAVELRDLQEAALRQLERDPNFLIEDSER